MDGARLASVLDLAGGDVDYQLGGLVTVTAALFTSGASGHHGPLRCVTLRQSDNLIGRPPGLLGCPFQSPGPPGPRSGNPRAWGHDAHCANSDSDQCSEIARRDLSRLWSILDVHLTPKPEAAGVVR